VIFPVIVITDFVEKRLIVHYSTYALTSTVISRWEIRTLTIHDQLEMQSS